MVVMEGGAAHLVWDWKEKRTWLGKIQLNGLDTIFEVARP